MNRNKKQATEELMQTQVLNIEEVRRVAKYEKKLSKKPAAFCAIIGTFMILFGGGAQGYISYNNMLLEQSTKQHRVAERKVEEKEDKNIIAGDSTLSCYLSRQGNADGTNYIATFTFNFKDSKLKKVKKELMMDGVTKEGLLSMASQYEAHKTYASLGSTVPGYNIVAGDRDKIGFYVTNEQDLTILNPKMIPDTYSVNMYASVDHKLDAPMEEVQKLMESRQFECKLDK